MYINLEEFCPMPQQKEICSQSEYCDKIYAYLQINSIIEDGIRKVPKKIVKYTTIAKYLNISR